MNDEEELCYLLNSIALEGAKRKTFKNDILLEEFKVKVEEASECITGHPLLRIYYKDQYKKLKFEKRKEFLERLNEIIIKLLELDKFERENRK